MQKSTLTLVCITAWLSTTSALTVAAESSGTAPVTDQIVVFNLSYYLREAPPLFDFGFEQRGPRTLHELLSRLEKAGKDKRVKAVVFTFDRPALGWAQMQELRAVISELRGSGKDVFCHLEEAGLMTYQLASAATRIYMMPAGDLDIVGLHAKQAYFKRLMDKIGISADILQMGAYKGAGEPFTREGPSEEAARMLDWLIRDLYEQTVETLADARGMTTEEMRKIIDRGPFTAKQAKQAGLIDDVFYAQDLTKQLRQQYSKDVEFVRNYGAKEAPDVDFSSPFAIFRLFGEAMHKGTAPAKPSVAVIYIDGMIVTGKTEDDLFGDSGTVGSTTVRHTLTKALKDDSIKAVVLRINSPGGSSVASEVMWNAAKELSNKKPLIVSMGDTAASGGYYAAVGAQTIFADPGTITGSIGVIGGKLVTSGLWDWLGVTFHETTYGKNADLFTSSRPFTDEQRALVRQQMQSVYDVFKQRVVSGRGTRLQKDIESLAGGRVYTGRQALEHGLIDHLGGMHDAVRFAAKEADLTDYEVRQLPEPRNFLDAIVKGLTGETDDDEDVDIAMRSQLRWTLETPVVRKFLPIIQAVDPQQSASVLRALLRIELLGREHCLMVLPSEISIH